MIVKDPGVVATVSAHPHYSTSHKTGTEIEVESKEVLHSSAPIEKTDLKYKKVWHIMETYWLKLEERKYIGSRCWEMPDPFHCKAMITHTCNQETHCWYMWVWLRNNLFWMYDSLTHIFPSYNTRMDSIKQWLDKYEKYRYKNSCRQMLTRSNYCYSWCNDWVPNCEYIFNKFKTKWK